VPGTLTQNDYANIRVLGLPSIPSFDLIGIPAVPTERPLAIDHTEYSPFWHEGTNSQHVLVDGLLNGWHVADGRSLDISYVPSTPIKTAFFISLLGFAAITGSALAIYIRRIPIRRARRNHRTRRAC
jgi:hypothetical protein